MAAHPQPAQVQIARDAGPTAAVQIDTAVTEAGKKPLMGWSSWSLEAYGPYNPDGVASWLTESNLLAQADAMADKLKPYGYEYVNMDGGWYTSFDEHGRPVPDSAKFPHGLKYVADHIHAKGLKFGIYSEIGLLKAAYGDGTATVAGAPDCHLSDVAYPDLRPTSGFTGHAYKINFGTPCGQAYIDSIVAQYAEWGVDFLKLDAVGPGSYRSGDNYDNRQDVAAWSKALTESGRSIRFVVSWSLSPRHVETWQKYTNGWRIDNDVECHCSTLVKWNTRLKDRWNDVVQWIPHAGPGHWNDLDSMNVGNGAMDGLNDAERQSVATLWAIESANFYMGDDLTKLDDLGLKLLTNKEVIAVNQAGNPAKPLSQTTPQQVWYARNADGSYTVALFNLGDSSAPVTAHWDDLGVSGAASVRDLWSRKDIGKSADSFSATLPAHGSRLLRVTPDLPKGVTPTMPGHLRATAASDTSVSLAWDPSWRRGHGATPRYSVYVDGAKAATVTEPAATVKDLRPGAAHRFTVVAEGPGHGPRSAPSKTLTLVTPGAGGPTTYEAESPGNTLAGGAAAVSCAGCSGGKRVGKLGTGGTVTFTGVTAPRDGTYLMKVAFLDGDSGRKALVKVNGSSFELPVGGNNESDWNTPNTITVPVELQAGQNTVEFGNPGAAAYDIDNITL
ncbi:fibronectin type III domain-containing protein [Streptomyces sp. NBC_00483]|uniref:fibronectin type III domain-containing protein n=1 Tax=Streptomyces sp. NBC_00483 TaxID=2975756 RepID=UPI002E19AF75